MTLTIFINIPNERLDAELAKGGMTREQFKSQISKEMMLGIDAEDLCPGATATIEVKE